MSEPKAEEVVALMLAGEQRYKKALNTMSPEVVVERIKNLTSSPAAMLEFEQNMMSFDFLVSMTKDDGASKLVRDSLMIIECLVASGGVDKILKKYTQT